MMKNVYKYLIVGGIIAGSIAVTVIANVGC